MGSNTTEYVQVKELKMGMKNVNLVVIVLETSPPTVTKEAREVRTLRVADASASVNLTVWDAAGALLLPGDIVRLTRGFAGMWRAQLTLYTSKAGDLQKVGEFCMLFNEQLNMSEPSLAPPPAPPLPPPANGARALPASAAPPSGAQGGQVGHDKPHKTYVRGGGGGGARANHRNASRR